MAKAEKRMDKDSSIQKVAGVTGGFLANYAQDNSLAALSEYVIVPRLKIIQSMTAQELKIKMGGEGNVCVRPGDHKLAAIKDATTGEPFLFVPQFFFSEWCKWADRNDQTGPRIIARSYDPSSDLAKRAAGKETRTELYPNQDGKKAEEQWKYSYVHHFCYAGVLYSGELKGTSVVVSMERGEFGNGKQFNTAIDMRRHTLEDGSKVRVPLWAQVWEMFAKYRDRGSKKWWGFDFQAPADAPPIIADAEEQDFQAEHLRLADLHEKNRLRVDHAEGDETGTEGEAAPTVKASAKF